MGEGQLQVLPLMEGCRGRSRSREGASSRSSSSSTRESKRFKRSEEIIENTTEEQDEITKKTCEGASFRVLANAGSGKTMSMILAASRLLAIILEVRILFLAYIKDIKEEVKKKAKEYLGEDRISVENYDSLLVNYYDSSAASQDFALSMRRVVQNDEDPLAENRGNLAWDLVIVD